MLNRDKHRQLLFQILKDIFSSELWKYLAFKWWTACYFLYGLDRFSTDLDFDVLQNGEDIDEKMVKILSKYGKVKKWNKLIVSYQENAVNIKVDINRKIRKANTYEWIDFYGTTIRVQDKATIFANKLVAMIERNTNRDIYDIYFFFQNLFAINEQVIQERTWKSLKELYRNMLDFLQKLPKKYKILDWLGEVLDEKQKHFVKDKLLYELINILHMKIDF